MCISEIYNRCCNDYWQVNGICEVCPPGYHGVNCTAKCRDGYFGILCKQECDCENGIECHFKTGCLPNIQYVNQTVQDSYITKSEGLDLEPLSLIGYLAIGSLSTIALIVVLVYIKICFQKKRTFMEVISAIAALTGPLTRSRNQRSTCDSLTEEGAVGGSVIVSCGNQGIRTSVNEYSTISALSDYHTLSNDNHQPLRTTAKIKIERKPSSLTEITEYEERQKRFEDAVSSLVSLPSEALRLSSRDSHVTATDLHSSNKAAIETNYEQPEINPVFHENNRNGSESHSSEQDLVEQGHAENEQLLIYDGPENVYESEADPDVQNKGRNQMSKCEYTKLKSTRVEYKNNDDQCNLTKGLEEEVYLTPRKELAEVCTNRIEEILSSNDTAIVRDKNVVLSNKDTETETGYHDEIVLTNVTNYESIEKENSIISKSPENYVFHDDNNETTFNSNESPCVNEDEENYLSGHNMHGLQTQNKSLETLTENELQTLKDVHCKFERDESRKSNFEAKPNCQYNAESEIRDISKDIKEPCLSSDSRPYSVVNKKGKHIKHDDNRAAVSVTEDIYAEGETESKEKRTKRIMLNTLSEGIRPYSVVQNANTPSNDDGINHYMETNELSHHFYDPDWRTLERCKLQKCLPDIVLSGEQCGIGKGYVPDSYIDLPSTYRHNQGKASTLPCSIGAVSSNKDDSNSYETFDIHDQQYISKMPSLGSRFKSFKEQVRSTFKLKSKSTMREKEKTVFNETLLDQNVTEDTAEESMRPYSVVKKD